MSYRCNPYGAESGEPSVVGGLLQHDYVIRTMWNCESPAEYRFRWRCANGHRGRLIHLCRQHYLEFTGSPLVAVNLRRQVTVCPTCSSLAPDCDNPDHQRMLRGVSGPQGRCGCREPKVAMTLEAAS